MNQCHAKDDQTRRYGAPLCLKPLSKTLKLAVSGIMLLSVVIIPFLGCGNNSSTQYGGAVMERLDQMEERLIRLEGMEEKIVLLQERGEGLQADKLPGSSDAIFEQRLNELAKKFENLQKKVELAAAGVEASNLSKREVSSSTNGRYHLVQPGQTLYRISRKYGISVEELCRLNNINTNHLIHPGQKLLVCSPVVRP